MGEMRRLRTPVICTCEWAVSIAATSQRNHSIGALAGVVYASLLGMTFGKFAMPASSAKNKYKIIDHPIVVDEPDDRLDQCATARVRSQGAAAESPSRDANSNIARASSGLPIL
jgi:hypothetical protein